MAFKKVKERAETYWSRLKKTIFLLCVWGVVFSLATILKLGVGFGYDGTLVCSDSAYKKAVAEGAAPGSYRFWSIVNNSYDLERPKIVPTALAWILKGFGFHVSVLASRPDVDGDGLRKDWRRLVAENRFLFADSQEVKIADLARGNYVLLLSSDDSDIAAAKKNRVFAVRVKRDLDCGGRDSDYHPRGFGEPVFPLSQY